LVNKSFTYDAWSIHTEAKEAGHTTYFFVPVVWVAQMVRSAKQQFSQSCPFILWIFTDEHLNFHENLFRADDFSKRTSNFTTIQLKALQSTEFY
jgi:hypothetical protein